MGPMAEHSHDEPSDDIEDLDDLGLMYRALDQNEEGLEDLRKVLAQTERKSITGEPQTEPDPSLLGYDAWGDVGPLSGGPLE